MGAGGGWLWLRWRRAAPLLEGTLRRLAAPSGQTVPARLDLDALERRDVSLGPGPNATLRLPCAAGVRLVARIGPDGQPGTILTVQSGEDPAGQVQVNDLPVASEWPLRDGDVISLGPWRFRYENLRRRAATHRSISVKRHA